MSKTLFEIVVNKPNRQERFWHVAPDPQTIADLLGNSREAEYGFPIQIVPADPASVSRLLDSGKFKEVTGNMESMHVLLAQLYNSLMPVFACRPPQKTFIDLYTQPRTPVKYDALGIGKPQRG